MEKITYEQAINAVKKLKDIGYSNADNLLKEIEQKNIILKANELGFKIGDKVWNKQYNQYCGVIKTFYLAKDGKLCVYTDHDIKNNFTLEHLTNKVAVHCPTKEDFEFINKLFNYIPHSIINDYNDCEPCILVNDKIWDNKTHLRLLNYLILSIDEYCKINIDNYSSN